MEVLDGKDDTKQSKLNENAMKGVKGEGCFQC